MELTPKAPSLKEDGRMVHRRRLDRRPRPGGGALAAERHRLHFTPALARPGTRTTVDRPCT